MKVSWWTLLSSGKVLIWIRKSVPFRLDSFVSLVSREGGGQRGCDGQRAVEVGEEGYVWRSSVKTKATMEEEQEKD